MSDHRYMVEYMNELMTLPSPRADSASGSGPAVISAEGAAPVPLERLEARICELAGHLTAATCQFLLLVADFDERKGWADWEMASCAGWLSWKCQIAPGTAREQVRVAPPGARAPTAARTAAAAWRLAWLSTDLSSSGIPPTASALSSPSLLRRGVALLVR